MFTDDLLINISPHICHQKRCYFILNSIICGDRGFFYTSRMLRDTSVLYFPLYSPFSQCDQPKEGLVNKPSDMDKYCQEKGFIGWYETSAKENINIDDASKTLVEKVFLIY